MYIGIHVEHSKSAIKMHQKSCILRMLDRFAMTGCKPAPTPACHSLVLSKEMSPQNKEEEREMKLIPFRSLTGSILYAAGVHALILRMPLPRLHIYPKGGSKIEKNQANMRCALRLARQKRRVYAPKNAPKTKNAALTRPKTLQKHRK